MIVIVIAACAGVALLQVAAGLLQRHANPPRWALHGYRLRRPIIATIGIAACAVALAAGLPGKASDQWQEFKNPSLAVSASQQNRIGRFASASGHGRYQFWQSAARAEQQDGVRGIGPGSFEYWWARDGSLPWFVRNAHSLYMETLAETGIVGLLLLVGFLGYVLTMAARAARRAYGARSTAAAAAAAIVAFLVAAGVDWIWQVPALPITFLMLAGAVAAVLRPPSVPRLGYRGRAVVAVAAIAASIPLVLAAASASSIRDSQLAAAKGSLSTSLADADRAAEITPKAATPRTQAALVLEAQGRFAEAETAARAAVDREPTNWRNWVILARIRGEAGDAQGAVAAFRHARSLNPRSPVFAR